MYTSANTHKQTENVKEYMFVFNIAREQIMGGDCAALYAH